MHKIPSYPASYPIIRERKGKEHFPTQNPEQVLCISLYEDGGIHNLSA